MTGAIKVFFLQRPLKKALFFFPKCGLIGYFGFLDRPMEKLAVNADGIASAEVPE